MGGLCTGQPKSEQDTKVTKELKQDRTADADVKKLLLLGAGGSGKSTLFKQLQSIHGTGFSERDRRQFRSQIHEQMVEAMKIMLTKCEDYIEEYEEQQQQAERKDNAIENVDQYRVAADNEDSAELVLGARSNSELQQEMIDALSQLWADAAIQLMFAQRNLICVPDSTSYFLNDIQRVTSKAYSPSDGDLLLVRYRTTGMAEKTFEIKSNTFQICDVGGQRNERRKWIHFFDNVTAVVFVASLSAYDEVTFEDETANSMDESVEVFRSTLASESFVETAFILFLNKNDLFEDKIQRVPLTVCWPEYTGDDANYDQALAFIEKIFDECNVSEDREIYTHVTQATDTNNVERVFNDVQHVVVDWSLQRSGIY